MQNMNKTIKQTSKGTGIQKMLQKPSKAIEIKRILFYCLKAMSLWQLSPCYYIFEGIKNTYCTKNEVFC